MSLLREIQASLMREGTDIGSILLKLRLLASRLGSDKLEEWVHYEMEGYPTGTALPDYRKLVVSYTGTFFGPAGSGIRDAPIPPLLIKKYAGENRLAYEERRGVVAVEHFIRETTSETGTFLFEAADLILLIRGKVYPGTECNSVTGRVSIADYAGLVFSVRSRVLNLTTELEKSVPAAADIVVDRPAARLPEKDADRISITVGNLISGNQNVIASGEANAQSTVNVEKQNISTLINVLTEGGIPESDAQEFADILSREQPTSKEEPLGEEGKKWLRKYLEKAGETIGKTGVSELTKRVTEAAVQYFGFG